MPSYLLIRKFENSDEFKCQEVIKEFVMSGAKDAFFDGLFREITLQLVVLVWAIAFIFFGIPLLYCIFAVPFVIFLIFVFVYGSHYTNAMEQANARPKQTWVVEVFEPYISRVSEKETEYTIINKKNFNESHPDIKKLRKSIIGTIGLKSHLTLDNSAWIFRLAIHPNYPFCKIGEPLVVELLTYCHEQHFYSVEVVTSECREEPRELYTEMGFVIIQAYHKNVIGSSLRILRTQLRLEIAKWSERRYINKC